MSVARPARADIVEQTTNGRFHTPIVRYLFAIATVAGTFLLRVWLIPVTGTGAPFVLFFGALLLTSLLAGVGPGICALLLSLPLAVYTFVTRADYPPVQAAAEALLFGVDGAIAIYLTFLMKKGRQGARDANVELHKANEEAARSMARTREVIELAPDAFFQADLDGRFTDVNQAACRLLGYERGELLGKSIVDIIPPEDVPRLLAAREYLLAPGTVQVAEWTHLKKDGSAVPVEVSSTILPDGRWQAFVRNITERRGIENELTAANASLDAIIEHIPLMLFMKESASLRFVRFNRAGEELLGWTRETFIGKSDYDFWPREQAEFFVAKDRETLTSGEVVDIPEEPIQTRAGVRLLHTKKVPIYDPAGHPAYLLGISEDITERRRIEREQQFLAEVGVALSTSLEYEQTLATLARAIVEQGSDWCVIDIVDDEGKLHRLKVVSRDPSKAALCAALEQLPRDRDLPHLMRFVIDSRQPLVVEDVTPEYVASVAQGSDHQHALQATGLTSFVAVPMLLRGQPLGALLFGSSTASRVHGPGDLPFAQAIADRAALAIENARLYRAAVRATQLRDQVLGVVAHDLRNPLYAIQMQASTLERRSAPERRSQKPQAVIQRAVTGMHRMIQDLLDVAVMEAGQLTIQRVRLSARELVVEAVDLQRPVASSAALELRVDLHRDVPEIWGDRDRLLQVFDNLIGNAIKFTQPGGDITVGAAPSTHEVVFRVADTGCGIASENLGRVFDRFWQATRTVRQGAGLGLPIAKGIVEAHGGRVWVESTEGRGTTFFFTIPTTSASVDA